MRAASDKLNPYTLAFEEAQTEIRQIVKTAFLRRVPKAQTNKALYAVIRKSTSNIAIPRLKASGERSLWNFADIQRITWESADIPPEIILLLGSYASKGFAPDKVIEQKISRAFERFGGFSPRVTDMGVPLNRYYGDVWKKQVEPLLDKLARENALDPNDFTGRNSLRNLAEMEVRYQGHIDEINKLKTAGIKLVVCSSHADCSVRCAPWQGRIYSLDGTSGTVDGHKYVPLETATDHFYTTKAGITYKNGLLGFNCRHYLEPYRGQLLPTVSSEVRRKEYAITMRQRELERLTRRYRTQALMCKDINKAAYEKVKHNAATAYKKYIDFCKENDRAYYPMRTIVKFTDKNGKSTTEKIGESLKKYSNSPTEVMAAMGINERKMTPEEKIASVHIDFGRDNILPELNEDTLKKIGVESKLILLKGDVIKRNLKKHFDVSEKVMQDIISEGLYNPVEVFAANSQKSNYFHLASFIEVPTKNGLKMGLVLLDADMTKNNFEIVHAYFVDSKGVEKAMNKTLKKD